MQFSLPYNNLVFLHESVCKHSRLPAVSKFYAFHVIVNFIVVHVVDVACLVEYKGLTLAQACEKVVNDKLVKLGGEGGLIALDKAGNISLVFNSEGMYRGYKRQGEDLYLGIYK